MAHMHDWPGVSRGTVRMWKKLCNGRSKGPDRIFGKGG